MKSNGKYQIEFVYPPKPWKLPLFCHLWLLFLFAYLYYGRVPDPFTPAYTSTVIGYLVIVSIWLWEWPARFLGAGKPITLSQSGITATGRFAKWDDIQKIQHGPLFFFRHSVVYLKLKREKKSFFSISIRRRYLPLIGYPFIYREVLPAILSFRPDVPVSPVVKRNMEAPEKSRGLYTWFVLLLLTLYIILLYLISLDDFQTLLCYISIGAILVLLSTSTSNSAIPFATTNRERFIEFVINSMLLIGVAIKLFPFSTADYIVMEVLITTAILVCIMAVIILFTTEKLSALLQVCIIWVFVLSPICLYLYSKSQTWQPRDISHQLEQKDWAIPLWSSSGDYLTCLSYEENGFIIKVPSLKNVSVPEHIGKNRVVWLSNEYLLRTIESNDKTELWFYNFTNDVELKVPTGEKFSIGNKRPICHQEKYLAWIDFGEDVNNGDVRFWNLKKNIEDMSPVSLPQEISWKSGQVVWLDQNKIAVCAKIIKQKAKEDGTRLAVLFSNLDEKERRLYTSSTRFDRWYPTMYCQYAFGVNSLEHDRYSVTFVDLTTDESIELTGEDFPIFVPSSNYAFRITYNSGKPYLTRFEFNTLKYFPLYRVPDNTKVIAVSKTGKFVLLGLKKDFLAIPVYYVLHVPSGKKHKIHLAGLGSFHSPEISAIYPGASNFSPNERFFLLNIAQGSDLKLLLYDLPDSW
jgi:hypothetical protein